MTKWQMYVKMIESLHGDLPLEDKAKFFALITNKPIDIDEIEWYNKYRT